MGCPHLANLDPTGAPAASFSPDAATAPSSRRRPGGPGRGRGTAVGRRLRRPRALAQPNPSPGPTRGPDRCGQGRLCRRGRPDGGGTMVGLPTANPSLPDGLPAEHVRLGLVVGRPARTADDGRSTESAERHPARLPDQRVEHDVSRPHQVRGGARSLARHGGQQSRRRPGLRRRGPRAACGSVDRTDPGRCGRLPAGRPRTTCRRTRGHRRLDGCRTSGLAGTALRSRCRIAPGVGGTPRVPACGPAAEPEQRVGRRNTCRRLASTTTGRSSGWGPRATGWRSI